MDDISRAKFDIATYIELKPSISGGKEGQKRRYRRSLLRYRIKPSISGPILGGKDMQILNIWPGIKGFLFDIEYQPSILKAHEDDIE
jgi:hypothetical protein